MYHNCNVWGVKDSFDGLAAGTLEVAVIYGLFHIFFSAIAME
jgi:hypothetical protein